MIENGEINEIYLQKPSFVLRTRNTNSKRWISLIEFPDINRDYLPLMAKLFNEQYGFPNSSQGHMENGNVFEII